MSLEKEFDKWFDKHWDVLTPPMEKQIKAIVKKHLLTEEEYNCLCFECVPKKMDKKLKALTRSGK